METEWESAVRQIWESFLGKCSPHDEDACEQLPEEEEAEVST